MKTADTIAHFQSNAMVCTLPVVSLESADFEHVYKPLMKIHANISSKRTRTNNMFHNGGCDEEVRHRVGAGLGSVEKQCATRGCRYAQSSSI